MTNQDLTEAAVSDLLAQSVPVRVLLVLQGVDPAFAARFQKIAEQDPRLLVWWHDPALPSLSATWNRALQCVWTAGGEEAIVANNDVRLHQDTVRMLVRVRRDQAALFVTAVGVTAEQFDATCDLYHAVYRRLPEALKDTDDWTHVEFNKGGPDFSCFLISKEGHAQYPFDENFVPAFCEDLDSHRRYMLGGDGERIFSINLPYHHIGGGSQTLKSMAPEARAARERLIDQSRAYYTRKWGGGVNQEKYTLPFDIASAQDGVTTPELQRMIQQGAKEAADVPLAE